jgi:multidrug efflux system membrane fusion protein
MNKRTLTYSSLVAGLVACMLIASAWWGVLPVAKASVEKKPAVQLGQPVEVTLPSARTIEDWRAYAGRLDAVEKVEVRPLVSGTIVGVHFTSGAVVKKGDVLFTIDARPYTAEAMRAEAALQAAQSGHTYAEADLARAKTLVAENAIAQIDFERRRDVEQTARAGVRSAQAALEIARLNLAHTRVVSPLNGRVAYVGKTAGNVVAPGTDAPPLTTVVSSSRMYATFDVDEQTFLHVIQVRGKKPVPVLMGLITEQGHPRRGVIEAVDNQLNTASGTVKVRAVFDNTDGALMPGLYARIRLRGATDKAGLLIAEKAIGIDQDRSFVLVVDKSSRAVYRQVTLGGYQDGMRVVDAGLGEGERIVADGPQRVQPGTLVDPRPVVAAALPAGQGAATRPEQ